MVVFACLKCDQILKCLVAVVKVNRYDWMKNLTRAQAWPQRRRSTAPTQEKTTNIAALTATTQAPAGIRSK